MAALEQRRGDDVQAGLVLPVHTLLEQGILTPIAFNVAAVVKLTARSSEDDLTQVPEFLRWASIGAWLGGLSGAVKWWIGDWLAFGEGAWGERYAQAAEATGLDIGTLQNYAYVCRQVLPSRRREELSFTSHLKVAKLDPPAQTAWLDHAIKHELRSKELAQAILEHDGAPPSLNGDGPVDGLPEPEQRPDTYIDPLRVVAAARRVWRDAKKDAAGGGYRIPAGAFDSLATALGKGDA